MYKAVLWSHLEGKLEVGVEVVVVGRETGGLFGWVHLQVEGGNNYVDVFREPVQMMH